MVFAVAAAEVDESATAVGQQFLEVGAVVEVE